jgi:hypothetical protein
MMHRYFMKHEVILPTQHTISQRPPQSYMQVVVKHSSNSYL